MPYEISALTALITDVVRSEVQPVREEIEVFRSEVNQSFDALFKRNETLEEEYLAMREQISRLETKNA